MNNEEITSIFMQRCIKNTERMGSFYTWTILRNGNLIVLHWNQNFTVSKTVDEASPTLVGSRIIRQNITCVCSVNDKI